MSEIFIEFLKKEINRIRARIAALLAEKEGKRECGDFSRNLFFGDRDGKRVRCLQAFLKSQGPEIYPQGLVTGYFGPLTRAAVARFQEKYADEILAPLGLESGTGVFGPLTRAKANEIRRLAYE